MMLEAMAVIPHCNGNDWWIISHGAWTTAGTMYITLVTAAGPVSTQTYVSGLNIPGAPVGAIVPSADGTRFAVIAVASYSVAGPILKAPEGATDPVAFVQSLAAALRIEVSRGTHEERLRERVAAVHAAGRGRLVARAEGGYDDAPASDANAAWETLVAGGCWIDEAAPSADLALRPCVPTGEAVERWRYPAPGAEGLALVAFAARGTAGTTPPSPLLTKLYQESDLRPPATVAAVGALAARRLGLVDRQPVRVEGPRGGVRAELRIDPSLPPDTVALAAGPDPAALHPGAGAAAQGALPVVEAASDGTWRGTRVRVREARA